MTLSNRLKPFMAYLEPEQHAALTKYSKKNHLPMSQLVREAIAIRIAPSDPYRSGFNDGIKAAIEAVAANKASQMRFPSGKSFADLINEELETLRMTHEDSAKTSDAGRHEGSSGFEDQSNPGMGG